MTETLRASNDVPAPGDDRLRTDLADTLNHELRTPLTALIGHAELLQDLDLPDAAQASISAIVRAGERLRVLAGMVTEIVELDRRTEFSARA